MYTCCAYKEKLPAGKTFAVYNNKDLIFTSSGKWLNPLFELETFLHSYTGPRENLCAHDTAVGKAAAVLMIRVGIKHIYANLGSRLAQKFIKELNKSLDQKIDFECDSFVDRILCATEAQLEPLSDINEMYGLLCQRAERIQAGM